MSVFSKEIAKSRQMPTSFSFTRSDNIIEKYSLLLTFCSKSDNNKTLNTVGSKGVMASALIFVERVLIKKSISLLLLSKSQKPNCHHFNSSSFSIMSLSKRYRIILAGTPQRWHKEEYLWLRVH